MRSVHAHRIVRTEELSRPRPKCACSPSSQHWMPLMGMDTELSSGMGQWLRSPPPAPAAPVAGGAERERVGEGVDGYAAAPAWAVKSNTVQVSAAVATAMTPLLAGMAHPTSAPPPLIVPPEAAKRLHAVELVLRTNTT